LKVVALYAAVAILLHNPPMRFSHSQNMDSKILDRSLRDFLFRVGSTPLLTGTTSIQGHSS